MTDERMDIGEDIGGQKRVFLIVLDSFGIGRQPDAAAFGDEGSNTCGAVTTSAKLDAVNLTGLGLFSIDGVREDALAMRKAFSAGRKKKLFELPGESFMPKGAFARLEERSNGKDTTIGHWEIAGIYSPDPLPTYPHGFPPEVIGEFERQTGRRAICNLPYSGTDVIRDYGQEHVETGALIVYTSADSVFQIAAHEAVVPPEQLYEYCEIARKILTGPHAVGRVIARPFEGEAPNFRRTPRRHDFSLDAPRETILDLLKAAGKEVVGIGKIHDIFAGRGLTRFLRTEDNKDGIEKTKVVEEEPFEGLCFVNLVDFDMKYGHRNDVDGYAAAITYFDEQLPDILSRLAPQDILIITADHGCDPSTPSTDHSRECVPCLIYGKSIREGTNLHTRKTFADIAATIAEYFELSEQDRRKLDGVSFLSLIT